MRRLTRAPERRRLAIICRLLLVAGNETTRGSSSTASACSRSSRGVIGELQARPEMIPSAIEETLRYYAPFRDVRVRRATSRSRGHDPEERPRLPLMARRTATTGSSNARTSSSSTATRTGTLRSGWASTTASAPRSPAWKARSPCGRCCHGSRACRSSRNRSPGRIPAAGRPG